jgi:hypothetical protein
MTEIELEMGMEDEGFHLSPRIFQTQPNDISSMKMEQKLENSNQIFREQIVEAIVQTLNSDAASVPAQAAHENESASFNCWKPTVSLTQYIQRLLKYTGDLEATNVELMMLAYIYLKRLKSQGMINFNKYTSHKLVLAALLVAGKYYHEAGWQNGYFAKAGGIRCEELNLLEMTFITLLDFNTFVDQAEYIQTLAQFVPK